MCSNDFSCSRMNGWNYKLCDYPKIEKEPHFEYVR
jgi:hypothetical protein